MRTHLGFPTRSHLGPTRPYLPPLSEGLHLTIKAGVPIATEYLGELMPFALRADQGFHTPAGRQLVGQGDRVALLERR